ncbi:MAG TPA: 3'(2'),5'-bisphosphate nucleotidase CysQ [Candidatus Kryptonia bacterium]|nr:3'(2'),5'-bisphosphate nucleotidase CysQ [Candidatus Kryptonia bacterium]
MPRRELTVAIAAARSAGAAIHAIYDTPFEVRQKGHDNPVTEADLQANERIHSLIQREFPSDGWLSEETHDNRDRLTQSRVWIVDPLDGTKEFVQHLPEFCVCIALVEHGEPIVAVSYNPIADELFAAARGDGLTLNGVPAHVSPTSTLAAARVLASRSEDKRGEWDAFKPHFTVELTGSVAYKLALIAAGRADATFSLTPKNEWDICAGTLLITEGGGRVTDLDGQPLRFNQADTRRSGLIASNSRLHAPVMELIARLS